MSDVKTCFHFIYEPLFGLGVTDEKDESLLSHFLQRNTQGFTPKIDHCSIATP
jgi:hypothetical protein